MPCPSPYGSGSTVTSTSGSAGATGPARPALHGLVDLPVLPGHRRGGGQLEEDALQVGATGASSADPQLRPAERLG